MRNIRYKVLFVALLLLVTAGSAQPSLVSPEANTYLNDNTPTFEWNKDTTNTDNAYLEIFLDENCQSNLYFRSDAIDYIDQGSYVLPDDNALPDDIYYWRIREITDGNSECRKLNIDTTLPVVPSDVLTNPNGGEIIKGGSTYIIEWNANKIQDENLQDNPISLYYSTDNGNTWSQIATNEANDGQYEWNVPNVDTNQTKVKIVVQDKASNEASDESDAIFIIDSTAPLVYLTKPASGEHIATEVYTVSADASDVLSGIDYVRFEYSLDNGITWQEIGEDNESPYEVEWNLNSIDDTTNIKVKATAYDKAGNSASSENSNIVHDTNPPLIGDVTLSDNTVQSGSNIIIYAEISDATSGVSSVYAIINGPENYNTQITLTDNDNDGIYEGTWTSADVEGTYSIDIIAIDNAGNENIQSNVASIIIDNTPPTIVTIISPIDESYVRGNIIINVSASDGETNVDRVRYYIDGNYIGYKKFPFEKSWNTASVSDGEHEIYVVAVDDADNEKQSESINIIVDNTPPSVDIISPLEIAPVHTSNGKEIKVSYMYSEENPSQIIIEIYNTHTIGILTISQPESGVNISRQDTIEISSGAEEGKYNIRVTIYDKSGNEVSDEEINAVIVDNTAPKIISLFPENGEIVYQTSINIEVVVCDDLSGINTSSIEVYYDGDQISTSIQDYNATCKKISASVSAPADEHWYFIEVKDNANHEINMTIEFETRNSYVISNLRGRWNLISLPLIPENSYIEDVLSGLSCDYVKCVEVVWYYNAATQEWLSWSPNAPSDLTTMEDGKGYWIKLTQSASLTVKGVSLPKPPSSPPLYQVTEGWNLVGFKSTIQLDAGVYLSSLRNKWNMLVGYDADQGSVTTCTYNSQTGNIDCVMDPGRGYWLYVTETGTIAPPA